MNRKEEVVIPMRQKTFSNNLIKLVISMIVITASSLAATSSFALPIARSITLSPGKTASASMLIRWHSDGNRKDMYVKVARLPKSFFEGGAPLKARTVKSSFRPLRSSSLDINARYRGTLVHSASISGLSPGTKYVYRIGSKSPIYLSKSGSFTTAPSLAGSFSFVQITDTQPAGGSETDSIVRALDHVVAANEDASFAVHSGDIVDNGSKEAYWTGLVEGSRQSLMSLPMAPASGNHDGYGGTYSIQDHFRLSSPAQDRRRGVYYSLDYGPAHFTFLNTNDLRDDGRLSEGQMAWLESDLSSAGSRWRIVVMHKGIYTTGGHLDDVDVMALRDQLVPVFDNHRVDLVLQGHDHVYARSHALRSGRVSSYGTSSPIGSRNALTKYKSGSGTVYLIPNTFGPKLYPLLESSKLVDIPMFSSLFARSIQPGSKYPGPDGQPLRDTVRNYASFKVTRAEISAEIHQMEGCGDSVIDVFSVVR